MKANVRGNVIMRSRNLKFSPNIFQKNGGNGKKGERFWKNKQEVENRRKIQSNNERNNLIRNEFWKGQTEVENAEKLRKMEKFIKIKGGVQK